MTATNEKFVTKAFRASMSKSLNDKIRFGVAELRDTSTASMGVDMDTVVTELAYKFLSPNFNEKPNQYNLTATEFYVMMEQYKGNIDIAMNQVADNLENGTGYY